MARQIGSTFTGTTNGLSFYYNRIHGHLVRRTGGVTSKQYHKDQRFAASRDASQEFCNVSRAGKLIRAAFEEFVLQVKDGTMVNRLTKELTALKQLDRTHFRGERRPEVMMTDDSANPDFRIFQFNADAKLYELTERFPIVEQQKDGQTIVGVRLRRTAFPRGATHAGLTLARAVLDFEKECYDTRSSRMAIVSSGETDGVSLNLTPAPAVAGTEIICLQVVFFREENGDFIQVDGKVHAMGVIAVRKTGTSTREAPSFFRQNQVRQPAPATGSFFTNAQQATELFGHSKKRLARRRRPRDYKIVLRSNDAFICTDANGTYFSLEKRPIRRRLSPG
jgi:hypothetical protein